MVASGHEHPALGRRGGVRQGQPDDLAGRRRPLGRDRADPAGRQAPQEARAPAARRPGDLRRADRASPDGQPVGPAAARVRPAIDRARALRGVGGDGGAGAGLGGPAPCIRRGGRPGLGAAGGRRLHRQGSVRPKGGAGEARAKGAQPDRPRQARDQAPLADRGDGRPRRRRPVGGQPARQDEAGRPPRRGRGRAGPRGVAPSGARPRLRLRGLPDGGRGPRLRRPRPPKASAARPLPPPGHPDRHPPRRWVAEVCPGWFNRFRRLPTRSEKRASHDLGFVHLAACLIAYRKIRPARPHSG